MKGGIIRKAGRRKRDRINDNKGERKAMDIPKELKNPAVAAGAGATVALVVATFVPAALILGLGAAIGGGVYLVREIKAAAKDDVIDVEPGQAGEGK